ncbi:type I polyketide synthase [Photobacterium lipolyticum]|uniref:Beta-ketoacyl synthase n=1 Tax=Photobacterium lipolyticum TaxID=266810 RepID=A0A2T3N0W4_9GAMM|nr:type I polyketide synthase [Photobacterium lipolyticum]PSW05952.1 beta-ketoacyl synthase [Photobacterium lipolyticum]
MSQTPKSTPESQEDKRLNKRLKDMPVAIVGMASIFANSRYLNKFWDLISEKIDAITDVPNTHWRPEDYYDADKSTPDKSYCKRGGFMPEVDFNPMEFGLPPNILELTDTSQLLSLIVAKEVLADAKLPEGYDRDKIGITLGVGGGQKISQSLNARLQYPVLKKVFKNSGINDEDSEMLIKKFQDQYIHWEENSFPGSLGNVIAGRIANRFDLGGMNCVVDAACAGSLAALRMALSELVEGRSEMMITGGVCTDNSPTMYMSFSKTPAFTTNETIQPFDIDSKGMMIGEGIGMVALKRLEDAERDGDRIYSVIKGVGASSDGKFKSIYAPRPEGQAKALKRAYDDAGFAPHTLGLLEAHGTGTAAGDVAEFNGLNSVFSDGNDTKQHIALGSVKSQIGHTKSTAGTAGLIKAALALHHKVLPATINVTSPNPKLNIEDSPFYLNTQTRPWMQRVDGTPRRAGVSSFGFGGTNFHVVMEEYTQEHARGDKYRQRQVPQTLLFSAASRDALIASLKETSANISGQKTDLAALADAYGLRSIEASHARLGLVVKTDEELQTQLTQAISTLESQTKAHWQLPSGTSYRESGLVVENGSAKVAALFAGQGSQYLNMGRELACHYPEMRQQLANADKVFGENNKTPLSQVLFPIPAFNKQDTAAQEATLTNTANAQSAIGVVSMGQYELMTQAGFKADMVAGHSFGELSALCASGVISQDDYYQLAFARGNAMAATPAEGDSGTMYAVILDADKLAAVEKCISEFDGVSIANYNAPTQLVIAGPTEKAQLAAKALGEQGFKAIPLPVSGAFHTPLVAHAQKPFAAAIDKSTFSKPALPLYSNATGELYKNDGKVIKKAFKQHMLQSVRFSTQLEAMYDAGARVFVEFGPKNILQKLVEKTLTDKAHELCTISINPNPKGDSDQQLRLASVQLAVAGISLDNIDPYQADIAQPDAASPMNIKLNATNYISASTRAKMAKSLETGTVSKQTEIVEKVVEKIVEKEVIKTEIREVPVAAAPQATAQAATQATTTQLPVGDASLHAFFAAQQQAAELHQQFLAIPQQYGDTFTTLMTEQAKMAASGVAIPDSLQRSMEMFHQHQAETLKAHAHYLELQANSNHSALGMLTSQAVISTPTPLTTSAPQSTITPAVTAHPVAPAQAAPMQAVAPASVQQAAPAVVPVQAVAPVQAPAPTVAPAPIQKAAAAPVQTADAEKVMLEVVADKTGYPTEMLDLDMDMEADLGIDSIKRVEILGTVQDQMPNLPELSPEDLAECRTLGEIVTYMNSKLGAQPAPAAAPVVTEAAPIITATTASNGLDAAQVQNTMLEVVADKTGYPTEMLDLAMDMEADLGIDSIKRVEILGTVQDQLPTLPELNPEDLAECRTLGEIVDYMNSKLPAATVSAAPVTVSTTALVSTPASSGLDAAQVQSTMLDVVADKTGYPTEMLDLAMDMEADLGIDSIKRVEILGTVQDQLPGLPELNPEDLAECRTLGEIVDYMNSKLPAASVAPAIAVETTPAPAASGLEAAHVQSTMLDVVADKTGYPAEMLDLAMDMEADLGIDSIKRVEILGTVQDQLPGLPELNPEDLAECRTLGEIVTYMQSKLSGASSAASATAAPVVEAAVETATVELPPHSEVALKKLPAVDKLADCFSKEACIVITDDGHNAGVLAEKLSAHGLQVAVVRSPLSAASPLNSEITSYPLATVDEAGVKAVITEIESAHKEIGGFIHLQPLADTQSDNAGIALNADAKSSISIAFLFAKLLHAQLNTASSRRSFFTVSRIDGGFGYLDTKQLANAELNQAALSGLTKTLSHEWSNVFCRALDVAPALDARHLAEAVTAELFDIDTHTVEIGLCEPQKGESGRATLIATDAGTAQTKNVAAKLTTSDKVLVTGGAKGVTFECALTLAKKCRSHFILAGRSKHITASELPKWAQGKQESELKVAAISHLQASGDKPTPKKVDALLKPVLSSLEINSALQAFANVGASAEYLSLDVSDSGSVAKTLSQFSDITGLIHGAGVLADRHIQDKTLDELNLVYGTKVGGLEAVLSALDCSKLKLLAMFSSAAGFYGNKGQSDYAMSNDILNKAALQFSARYPEAKVMSFNWGPWDGGMVNPALKKMFTDRGVYVIPLQAGAELFSSQLLSETGIQLLVGTSMQGSENKENAVKKLDAESVLVAKSPLNKSITVTRDLDPKAMPFLKDHCIAGNPVLPTVCAIQWMREIAEQLLGANVSVRNYKLLKGVIFDTDEVQILTLTLTPETKADDQIKALISCQGRPQYQAMLVLEHTTGSVEPAPAKTFATGSNNPVTTADALYSNGTLFHGPRLQGIQTVERFDDAGLLAQCHLPTIANADCGAFVPTQHTGGCQPFAEDYLLQAMLVWARLKYDAASLPSAIGEFVSYEPMQAGDKGWLELEVIKHTSRSLQANISLYHQDGRLSAVMNSAKVTISKGLNEAFLVKFEPEKELLS